MTPANQSPQFDSNTNEPVLSESDERFQALVMATSDVVYQMSADWRVMYQLVSKSFLPDTTATNISWLEQYIPPQDQSQVQAVIDEAIATQKTFELEHRVIRADGTIGWTFSRAIPLIDKQGQIKEWFGTARDITDRKQAEEALRQSEQQLADLRRLTLLSQTEALARIGSWEFDRQSGAFTWSAGMYRLTELNPSQPLRPEVYLALVIEEDRGKAQALVAYLRQGEGHFEGQFRIQTGKDIKTLRIKADVIGEGEQIQVVGVDMDITQQLLDQQQIQETAVNLQAVLDASPASIGLLKAVRDETGQVVNFRLAVGNDKLARFFGEPLSRLLGQPARRFRSLLGAGKTIERLHHVFAEQESFYEEKPLPNPQQDSWIAISLTRQDDGVVLTVLDITTLKQAQAQQQYWLSELEDSRQNIDALAQLKTALQHRSESLRAVSHDLKSNFGIITGSLSLLDLAESEVERGQFVEMALRNVKQATGLLGELLDLIRLESSEQVLHIDEKDIPTLLGELVESLQPLARQQGLSLTLTGPALLVVETDALLLYRLVQNLLMNALKYTQQGSVKLSWSANQQEEQWWFSVEDTGPGMAQELIERLNRPGLLSAGSAAETDLHRSIQDPELAAKESWARLRGEGIGLRIVREIVHLLRAELQVSSQAGVGTRFVVHLPRQYPVQLLTIDPNP